MFIDKGPNLANQIISVVMASVGVVALAKGCSGEAPPPPDTRDTAAIAADEAAAKRIDMEFGGGDPVKHEKSFSDCLGGSQYDPTRGPGSLSAIVRIVGGVIESRRHLHVGTSDDVLRFTDPGEGIFLEAADDKTLTILTQNKCPKGPYTSVS